MRCIGRLFAYFFHPLSPPPPRYLQMETVPLPHSCLLVKPYVSLNSAYLLLTDNLQQGFWWLDKEVLTKFCNTLLSTYVKNCLDPVIKPYYSTSSVTTVIRNFLTFVASHVTLQKALHWTTTIIIKIRYVLDLFFEEVLSPCDSRKWLQKFVTVRNFYIGWQEYN